MNEQIIQGSLYVVSTPIGNLGDTSHRAAHILGGVSLIAAEDTRTTRHLLQHLGLQTPLVSYHSHNESRRAAELVRRMQAGDAVALVTDAGTPGVSDPAHAILRMAIDAGIRVVPVPGASALLAALVVSGLPMDRFVFEGFLPLKKGRKTALQELARERRTVVLYESPHRIRRTLSDLLEMVGDRQVALARELTKKFEEVFRGSLHGAVDHVMRREPRGEYTIVLAGTGFSDHGTDPGTDGGER